MLNKIKTLKEGNFSSKINATVAYTPKAKNNSKLHKQIINVERTGSTNFLPKVRLYSSFILTKNEA